MNHHLKNYNFAMFILLCIYNFSGLKILNDCEPVVKSEKVDSESKENASNVYNEDEHMYLSMWNLIVCTIISIILLSIFNINFNDNNTESLKYIFSDYTKTFFEDFINQSSFMRFLFAFNYSTLCLIHPLWLLAFGIIIVLEFKEEICKTSDRSIWNKCRYIFSKIMIILTLSKRITGSGENKHSSLVWLYAFTIMCFCTIVILNYFMVDKFSNAIYWTNLIVLIISLAFIIIKIIVFKNISDIGICDILFGVKPDKVVKSVANLKKDVANLLNMKGDNDETFSNPLVSTPNV